MTTPPTLTSSSVPAASSRENLLAEVARRVRWTLFQWLTLMMGSVALFVLGYHLLEAGGGLRELGRALVFLNMLGLAFGNLVLLNRLVELNKQEIALTAKPGAANQP